MVVLEGVNPTIFNFVSDLVGMAAVVGVGFVFSYVYVLIMSWQVKSGKPIPVKVLGFIPTNFSDAIRLARVLKWSMPALVIVLLFLVTGFAHSIADLGLEFVTVEREGPYDTVLNLEKTNPLRLIHTSGDPLNAFTWPAPKSAYEGDFDLASVQHKWISSFMEAVDQIARGGSPFVLEDKPANNYAIWGGFNETKFFVNPDNRPLSQIDLEIPLKCTSSEMVPIDLLIPAALPDQQEDVETTALVPICTFSSPRSSGIYGGSRHTASVFEVASPVYYNEVFLTRQSGSKFQDFEMTPEMKKLAVYREDWRTGRVVQGLIDGLQIGTLDISLGTVVLATGPEDTPVVTIDGSCTLWDRYSVYALVGEVIGQCPPRPSGIPETDNSCFAIITLRCQTFPEDFENPALAAVLNQNGVIVSSNSDCTLSQSYIVWGEGFEQPDPDMIAVIAGMYGRVRPSQWNGNAEGNFMRNAILAALFAVSSLENRPITVEEVSPSINAVYIIFMLLPFFIVVGMVIAAAANCRSRLSIPLNPWELMVVGSEEDKVDKRSNKTEMFPKPDRQLVYALRGGQELGIVNLSEPISPASSSLNTNPTLVEMWKTNEPATMNWKTNEPMAMDQKTSAPPPVNDWKTANAPPPALTWNSNAQPSVKKMAKKSQTADPSGIYVR